MRCLEHKFFYAVSKTGIYFSCFLSVLLMMRCVDPVYIILTKMVILTYKISTLICFKTLHEFRTNVDAKQMVLTYMMASNNYTIKTSKSQTVMMTFVT